jgi:hypothetical protein
MTPNPAMERAAFTAGLRRCFAAEDICGESLPGGRLRQES